MTRRVLAYAGGGWMAGDRGSALDAHLLSLTGRERPRICLVPTASGDADSVIELFHDSFPPERAEASVLTLFPREVDDIEAFLAAQDVVYVGGGSTANLLAVWRLHGVDTALRSAYDAGTVLAGVSAGMNCWFEASVTDSFLVDTSRPLPDGLGILPGSCCPHYDGEASRQPAYTSLVAGGFPAGVAGDDDVAFSFEDERLVEVVSSRPGARAFRVSAHEGAAVEEPLEVRVLS
ncbi:putative peptidase YgaJ [Marmoricola endophyticus]|uniref:Peptidase YgaJ n=1 Tax=Marmoricola endophyticus TaxID=2040280 RepID=A0A917B8P4_9ACTN|nr:peptidase E [Marmoricola endophyticus]GGF31728.1 putative peptidase YgaJ [Marmoricola endophyticus]